MKRRLPPRLTLFPYTTLFRSAGLAPTRTSVPFVGRVVILTAARPFGAGASLGSVKPKSPTRSEEHTSELQSREKLVCRRLPEKKNTLTVIVFGLWSRSTPKLA